MIYLHGFASGGASTKATYLARRLGEYGIELQTPDLNLPDFSTLTITRMLEQTRALLDSASTRQTIIGSSLGGFVAVNAALKFADRVDRLVLLAPALDFDGPRTRLGDVGLEHWKASGQ
ncbi:MAG: alpha/beta fold hydrolase, partial [Acidobacteria bacterium]|nr:alpha/beta fold hydrolase [Acidobacteriota bacterium]